jgi:hypothetical protein
MSDVALWKNDSVQEPVGVKDVIGAEASALGTLRQETAGILAGLWGELSRRKRESMAEKLENIVRGADKLPFATDTSQTP